MFLDGEVERCLKENGYYLQTDVLDDKIRPAVGGEGRPRAIVKDIEVSGEPLIVMCCVGSEWQGDNPLILNSLKPNLLGFLGRWRP